MRTTDSLKHSIADSLTPSVTHFETASLTQFTSMPLVASVSTAPVMLHRNRDPPVWRPRWAVSTWAPGSRLSTELARRRLKCCLFNEYIISIVSGRGQVKVCILSQTTKFSINIKLAFNDRDIMWLQWHRNFWDLEARERVTRSFSQPYFWTETSHPAQGSQLGRHALGPQVTLKSS